MPTSGVKRSDKLVYCRMGFHDAYHSRGLLGYDLVCRDCGLVRYRDVDPPEWARFDAMRGEGVYCPPPDDDDW